MKRSTIAIIIPVFNVKNVVNETLLSVKNQVSPPDEVIIIDDGSTDGSINTLNNFKDLDGWKIIQTTNQGLGLTRNFGRSIATSKYVHFLDSDDIVKNDFIFRMRQVIKCYNYPDIILFSGDSFDDNEKNNKKPNLKFTLQGEYFRNSTLITKLVKKKESFPQASRYITKIQLWSKNKLNYPKGVAQDDDVFFPLLALSESTVVIPDVYFSYRVGRPGSITTVMPESNYAGDYLSGIKNTLTFMNVRYDLIKPDLSAWCYRLERRGLKYISMCLKTKTPISWRIILILFYKVKSISFPFKLFWRILRHFFR